MKFQLIVFGLPGVNGTHAAPHVDLALNSAAGKSLLRKGMVVHAKGTQLTQEVATEEAVQV